LEVHIGEHAHENHRHVVVHEVTVPRQPQTEKISATGVLCNLLLAGIDALARKELIARELLCCGMLLIHGTARLVL
jgi:hypothetical protein